MKTHRLILSTLTAIVAGIALASGQSQPSDSVKTSDSYPRKLITDFPVIYTDTAYATPHYHIVLRAVWMAKRGRNCKVTYPSQPPAPQQTRMIRFTPAP